jgi:hypothetical protein
MVLRDGYWLSAYPLGLSDHPAIRVVSGARVKLA